MRPYSALPRAQALLTRGIFFVWVEYMPETVVRGGPRRLGEWVDGVLLASLRGTGDLHPCLRDICAELRYHIHSLETPPELE